jgi:hypothetical protein
MDNLNRFQARVRHAGEEAFTGPEDDRDDVKDQFVDRVRGECLPDDRGTAGDVDVTIAGGRAGQLKGGGKTAGHEVERRPALLDRLVRKLTEKHVMRSAAELRQLASRRSAYPAQSDRSRGASGFMDLGSKTERNG